MQFIIRLFFAHACCAMALAQGAVVVFSGYETLATSSANSTGILADTKAELNILKNGTSGDIVGLLSADGSAVSVTTGIDPNDFTLSLVNPISAAVDKTSSGGSSAFSSVKQTIKFTLGVGETADGNFDINYSLLAGNPLLPGKVEWELLDPSGGIVASASYTSKVSNAAESAAVSLSQAGEYTLTLIAELTNQNINGNKDASSLINSISFSVDGTVPEPTTPVLVLLSVLLLLSNRRITR